ncbi:MAG: PBECR4 domain-containing protein [Lachnospira sp.]|nr:PBECR4 domain-containing protein [Lachnospira sp.]
MYSPYELKELTEKPRINDVSLESLRQYYEYYLNPFIYRYNVTYADWNTKDLELRFDYENFCHLLGIESIVKKSVSSSNLRDYKGLRGWENIKNGSLDIATLKKINKKQFMNVKAKYVYFYLIPNLLTNPLAVNYDKSKVIPYTSIESELIFYSQVENDTAIIHLGVECKTGASYRIPRTFFVEKVSSDLADIYVKNQEKIEVSIQNRIILQ